MSNVDWENAARGAVRGAIARVAAGKKATLAVKNKKIHNKSR
jgi:hypothetical protein